jgi:molecular chaperone GrpE (heat shock protein)
MDEREEPLEAEGLGSMGERADGDGAAAPPASPDDAAVVVPEPPSVEVLDRLGALERLFEERLRFDAAKEEAFRQLYEDLERFRSLASEAQYKPILIDIILLLDRLEKGIEAQPEDAFLASIRDELSEILARRGVSAMSSMEERFDPLRQRAVGVRPAADSLSHNTVAEVARTGYECDGQILRAAEVIVYRHGAEERSR